MYDTDCVERGGGLPRGFQRVERIETSVWKDRKNTAKTRRKSHEEQARIQRELEAE